MKKLLLIALTSLLLISCGHRKHKHLVVHAYKVKTHINANQVDKTSDAMDMTSDIFFYLINTGDGAYYTSSPTPVSTFSNVSWTKSGSIKDELLEEKAEELQETQIDINDVGDVVQVAANEEPESFEDSEADGESDGGSDGGSSDGGGDGGGGDGGGGGD